MWLKQFVKYAVRIETKASAARFNKQALPVDLLWGSGEKSNIAELQRRFSIPLGGLLLKFYCGAFGSDCASRWYLRKYAGGVFNLFQLWKSYSCRHSWVMEWDYPCMAGRLRALTYSCCWLAGFFIGRLYGWQSGLLWKLEGRCLKWVYLTGYIVREILKGSFLLRWYYYELYFNLFTFSDEFERMVGWRIMA